MFDDDGRSGGKVVGRFGGLFVGDRAIRLDKEGGGSLSHWTGNESSASSEWDRVWPELGMTSSE